MIAVLFLLLACYDVADAQVDAARWVGRDGRVRGCARYRSEVYRCDVVDAAGSETSLTCAGGCIRTSTL